MPDIKALYNRYQRTLFYILAIFVLGWGFTSYKTIFAGLILGTTAGFFNLWLLYRRTNKLGDAVAEGRTAYSLGSLSRLASAALVVLISLLFPEYFHIVASIIGLMTTIVVILIDSLFSIVKNGKQQEER